RRGRVRADRNCRPRTRRSTPEPSRRPARLSTRAPERPIGAPVEAVADAPAASPPPGDGAPAATRSLRLLDGEQPRRDRHRKPSTVVALGKDGCATAPVASWPSRVQFLLVADSQLV